MREVLIVALVLACPLMMIWMMRGHGHGHGGGHGHRDGYHNAASTEELRRQRDELDRAIAEREQFEPRDVGGQYGHDPTAPRSG